MKTGKSLAATNNNFQVNQLIKKLKIDTMRVDLGLDSRPPELKAITFKTESEADKLGILLMINAGYNPKYIKTMLEKLSNQSAGKILSFIGQTFFDDGHGTNSARVQRVNSYLQYAHVPDTPGIVSPEFQSAKEEILNKTE